MRYFPALCLLFCLSGCPNPDDTTSDPVCRNGILEGDEVCDDGNGIDNDGCSNSCLLSSCGDGVQHDSEGCDDGNDDNDDACVEGCLPARCGDGFTQGAVEECDDANSNDNDACLNSCMANGCGDGIVNENIEFCDDGNQVDEDECTNACEPARCGDGIILADIEACDDGNDSDTDACTNACEAARCGDGFMQPGEGCDDGNEIDEDACSNLCALASCGDGIIQDAEQCDDGNDSDEDDCLSTCVAASCGDGRINLGQEGCDDGNDVDGDDCTNSCAVARCGDGVLHVDVEACDDGNIVAGDDCTNDCTQAACGDGIVHQDVEACDDGNQLDTDDCLNNCNAARCGDGVVQDDVEPCDDGNEVQTDDCLIGCIAPRCGDRLIQEGVEDCDDGNQDNNDLCVADCADAACGDGFLQDGIEDCDDGNIVNGDGCDNTCGFERARVDPAQEGLLGRLLSGQAASGELRHVLVTYANASNLQEVGFVLQAHPDGRALAITVSAASLGLRAGDIINLDITRTYLIGEMRRGASVANLEVLARDEPLAAWTHDLTNQRTLPTEAMAFWRVTARMSVPADLTAAGGNYVSIGANTAGLAGRADVQFRINNSLQDALYIENTCEFTVTGVPLVRYGGNSQYTPTRLAEIEVHRCPATGVTSKNTLSATTLEIGFRRNLRPETVAATDFMISFDRLIPQLEISAAEVQRGRFILLTTAPQIEGRRYELRRIGDVHDLTGRNVVLNTRPAEIFLGYRPPARLLINEVNANASLGCDMIEFRITQGGLLRHTVKERTTVVHTFPETMVATNDIVVLHFGRSSTNCVRNAQIGATPGNETLSKAQFPSAQFAANYNSAWDHWTTDRGLTATDNVITLLLDGVIVDAVLVSDAPTGNAAASSESAARTVAAAGQWTTEAGDLPEGGFVDGNFNAHAAQDLNGAGTRDSSTSIFRSANTDRHHKGDWSFGPSSFGRAN
jgi:cysteine-rich repeat protein